MFVFGCDTASLARKLRRARWSRSQPSDLLGMLCQGVELAECLVRNVEHSVSGSWTDDVHLLAI